MNGCRRFREAGARSFRRSHALGLLAAGLLLAAGVCALAQDSHDPLLDLMIQKGMITQEEAKKVRAEADEIRTNAPPFQGLPSPKWKINNAINRLELYGDVRVRYENRSAEDPKGAEIDLQR